MARPDEMEAKVRCLNTDLALLRDKRLGLVGEAKRLREERDRLNLEHHNLIGELRRLRTRVKEVNQAIDGLRATMAQEKKKVGETREALMSLTNEVNVVRKQVKTPFSAVKQEMDRIEWLLQTSPTEMRQERLLMKRLKDLSVERSFHDRAEDLQSRMVQLKIEMESLRLSLRKNWESLVALREERKLILQKIAGTEGQALMVKGKADALHEQYVKKREEVDVSTRRIAGLAAEAKALEEKMAEREEAFRKGKIKALAYEIQEKMKRGEKITFQEFQVLSEAEGSS